MAISAEDMLRMLRRRTDDITSTDALEDYLFPIGWTIYRTDYNASDEAWGALVQRTEAGLRDEIARTFQSEDPKEKDAAEKIRRLVKIEGRSDPALLDGRTRDQVRAIFTNRVGGAAVNVEDTCQPFFLLADAEVFEAAARGENWIKFVDAKYDEEGYRPHPTRHTGHPKCFGWIRVATNSLLYMRVELETFELKMVYFGACERKWWEVFPVLEYGVSVPC